MKNIILICSLFFTCGLSACSETSDSTTPLPMVEAAGPIGTVRLTPGSQNEIGMPLEVFSVIGSFNFESTVDINAETVTMVIDIIDQKATPSDDLFFEDIYIATKSGERVTDSNDTDRSDGQQMTVVWEDVEFGKGTHELFVYAKAKEQLADEALFRIHSLSLQEVEQSHSSETISVDSLQMWPIFEIKAPEINLSLVELDETTVSAGDTSVLLASLSFDSTDSGENILVESFDMELVVSGNQHDVRNCELFLEDGTGIESRIRRNRSPYKIELGDDGYLFEKEVVTRINLYCEVRLLTGSTIQWNLSSTEHFEAEGLGSGIEAISSIGETPGTVLTVQ